VWKGGWRTHTGLTFWLKNENNFRILVNFCNVERDILSYQQDWNGSWSKINLKKLRYYLYKVIIFMLQVQTISHLVYIELLYIHKTNHSVKTQNIANVKIWRETTTNVTIRAWAILPWGIAKLTLYTEYEKPSSGKQEQAPLLHPKSQIKIFKQLCMSAPCYSSEHQKNGVKAWAVSENQYAYRIVISLSQNMSLCSHVSTSFSIHGMPLWHTLPYNVCYFMSVTMDNSMVIYPWESTV